ncbi:hypothetical protein ACTXT7_005066 [Hymenolepis weldensis]
MACQNPFFDATFDHVDKMNDLIMNGNTPLHEAASKGFSRSVEALCISRASLNIPNKMGLTPLHVAAQHGHKQSLRVLLFSGADINAIDGA